MPRGTKLHSKGKSNSIQKPLKVEQDYLEAADRDETMRQFQLELCWCIQRLEKTLLEKKDNEKQMQEAWKVLAVLKNNNQPLIRKRQLMRTHFGDYRAKMVEEEKKLVKQANKIKIETPTKPKATFIRKASFLTTSDNSFRFNFKLTPEQLEQNESTSVKTSNSERDTGKTNSVEDAECQNSDVDAICQESDIDAKFQECNVNDTTLTNDTSNINPAQNNNDTSDASINNNKRFIFTYSNSEFKFNFNSEHL